MKSKDDYFEDMAIDATHNLEFQVSASMVQKFAGLTGDFSSLHTDKAFGRRSMYRKNVIHGMLPVAFLSALKICYSNKYRCSFHKISGRFLSPGFVNDRLSLRAKIVRRDEEQKQIELEYILKNIESGSTLTTGHFTVAYTEIKLVENKLRKSISAPLKTQMVMSRLEEQDCQFEHIAKGDEKSFEFLISTEHAYLLYEILARGFSSDYQFDFSRWTLTYNPTNLLVTCLFSTFVGMCIPGRHGAFMDFHARFEDSIQFYKKYVFCGKVGFKSASTYTVVEDISIRDRTGNKMLYASGKISAKVNEPPVKMPSVNFLKDTEWDLQLKDKVVLVTGASRGIGETTAKMFSLHGTKVVVNYLGGKEEANTIVDEIISNGGEGCAIRANVADRKQVKQMIEDVAERYGTIHILVNNAVRSFYPIDFLGLTWEEVEKDLDVIIKGAFNCCQEVIPLMIENGGGKIINICTSFVDVPPPSQAKYVIAKSGLVGLTRSLAVEFAHRNIQVNAVSPSIVETDLTRHVSKIFLQGMRNDTPMKRNATPADVAKAVIFLSSHLASFTTGQKLMVTGGNAPFL